MKRHLLAACLLSVSATLVAAPQNGTQLRLATDPKDNSPWPGAPALAAAKRDADGRPLFAAADPLVFSLVADFNKIQGDRDPDSDTTYPATVIVAEGTPNEKSIPALVRTRGHSRLKPGFCTFAPLRLEFPSNPVGTVFEGQKKLKLGTHCRDQGEYGEYSVREWPVYRMFNILTPNSFRARLAEVHYVNTRNTKAFVRGGILLEDDDDLARRMGGRISDTTGLRVSQLDAPMTVMTTIFGFMIGNTDVSIRSLHNIRIVMTPDGTRFPVPYDFDFSGVVYAQYAQPNPMLNIPSVRDRLYLGPCQTPAVLDVFLNRFRAAREQLLAVYDTAPMLKPKYRAEAKEFLDGFYRRIETPAGVKRAFVDGCQTAPYM